MGKLMIVAAIAARDDVVVRTSVRLEGTVSEGKVVSKTVSVAADMPWEVKILHGLANLVNEMATAGVSGSIFIGGGAMPRYLQARKLISTHNAADIMVLPWMKHNGTAEIYRQVFVELLASLRRAKNRNIAVIVNSTRELYKVKLDGAEDLSGVTVDIRNGISEEHGVRVIGYNRFAGKVTVHTVLEHGSTVAYGEILVDSLPGRAKSFIEHGRTAVVEAMALLPAYTGKDETAVTVNGNF